MRQPPEKDEAGRLLRLVVEAEAGKDGGGARFGRMRVDVGQPHVDFGDAVRIGRRLLLGRAAPARSMSALSTISISGSSVPGASCATWPMRVFFGRLIEPVSDGDIAGDGA